MLTVVVYDISQNNQRTFLIKKLQHYGLKRIQKSVFMGYLNLNDRLDLAENLNTYLSKETDSIIIIPLCQNCKKSINLVGDANLPQKDVTYRFVWGL